MFGVILELKTEEGEKSEKITKKQFPKAMEAASNVSSELGLDLFRNVCAAAARTNNVFISTYGIVSALSLLMLGTRGKSEKDLLDLLKIPKDRADAYHQR